MLHHAYSLKREFNEKGEKAMHSTLPLMKNLEYIYTQNNTLYFSNKQSISKDRCQAIK